MCNSIINHRLPSPTGDGDARQACASPRLPGPLPSDVGHDGFSLQSLGVPPVRGVAPLEANLAILSRARRAPGSLIQRSPRLAGARGNPVQGSEGTWEGGRAGWVGGSCAQESWAPGAGKPGSRGSKAMERLVPRTEADLPRGNPPYFLVSIPDRWVQLCNLQPGAPPFQASCFHLTRGDDAGTCLTGGYESNAFVEIQC